MEPEYAPEYTKQERLKRAAVATPLLFGLFAACEWWLLPMWNRLAAEAPRRTVLGISGLPFVFYGIFVGLPWLFAALAAVIIGPTSIRTLKTKRYPPPGQKVYTRTQIKKGWRAVCNALSTPLIIALLIGLGAYGIGEARTILQDLRHAHPHGWDCAANGALKPTAKSDLPGLPPPRSGGA